MAGTAEDPRTDPAIVAERDIRPVVQRARGGPSGFVIAIGLLVAALLLFWILDAHRRALTAPASLPQPGVAAQDTTAPPLYVPPAPPPSPAVVPTPQPTPMPTPAPPPVPAPQPQIVYVPSSPATPPAQPGPPRNLAAPALVVDNGAPVSSATSATPPPSSEKTGNDTRDAVVSNTDRAHAAMFSDPATTVPQGTLIPVILETALDSSHAGFARALVQRDIRGFDGSKILIPRGSRLIGQYSGDVAQGQKRALIIWSRLIRPDGVTIALGSPAADTMGRSGVKAHVNSHFFARFSGAILQSVLDLGVNLASRSADSPVVVALPGSLQGVRGSVTQPDKITPTLKVKPGTSVSVFVARDLDFAGAGPAGQIP